MKNKIIFFLSLFFVILSINNISANELEVKSSNMKFDKEKKIMNVEGNVTITDSVNNQVFTDKAIYYKDKDLVETMGSTKILTSENYEVISENVIFDNIKGVISSKSNTTISDIDGNQIYLDMFEYIIEKNTFFSKGKIRIKDAYSNEYKFSEIYINEKNNKIVGSDVKIIVNDKGLKLSEENEPRIFGNTMSISNNVSEIQKGVFTYCKNRGEDKCPPWIIQSNRITHNNAKKTIYYDHAVIKVYDFPIFYFPKFSHPGPTVSRRSGFLIPKFKSNTNTGQGFEIPYFWNISKDKDITFSPQLYVSEHPLLLTEYRQDFKDSYLILDTGYTKGFKKTSSKKVKGSRGHFFSKFNMNLSEKSNIESNLEIGLQHVSHDKYIKLHDVNTEMVNKEIDVLTSAVNYNYAKEDNYLGITFAAYDNLTILGRNKYEYLLPYATFEKNLIDSKNLGQFDLSTVLRVRNYDVNKQTELFINDIEWKSNKFINSKGIISQLKGITKVVNYKAKNAFEYKTDKTQTEFSGVLGFLSKINLYKNNKSETSNSLLTPKLLIRYAPGHMRNIGTKKTDKLMYEDIFNIRKLNEIDVIETGLSTSLGFDYKKNSLNKNGSIKKEIFTFSAGQSIQEKENSDLPSSTSLDQRFSDIVGTSRYNVNKNLKLKYNFSLDQNYENFNFQEIGSDFAFGKTKFNIGYLQERNHLGDKEYIKTDLSFNPSKSTAMTFSTKRSLQTDSSEFYNLSYDYINDCLKAGLVYRREFYTDKDTEPTNTLMFKISLIPFVDLSSPTFGK
ncbi:MAG: LPS-assembly protein LptD [Pelagibacteraceae bacterium]